MSQMILWFLIHYYVTVLSTILSKLLWVFNLMRSRISKRRSFYSWDFIIVIVVIKYERQWVNACNIDKVQNLRRGNRASTTVGFGINKKNLNKRRLQRLECISGKETPIFQLTQLQCCPQNSWSCYIRQAQETHPKFRFLGLLCGAFSKKSKTETRATHFSTSVAFDSPTFSWEAWDITEHNQS